MAEQISENALIGSCDKLCQNWELSVDLNLDLHESDVWANIFGVTKDGAKDMEFGSRIPAVWVWPNERDPSNGWVYQHNRLHFSYRIGENIISEKLENDAFTNAWFNLKMSEQDGVYKILINDQLMLTVTQTKPMEIDDIKAVFGNSYYLSANERTAEGYSKNFKLTSNCDGK